MEGLRLFFFFDHDFLRSHLLDSTADAIWNYGPGETHCCASCLLRRADSAKNANNTLYKTNYPEYDTKCPKEFHQPNSI